MQTTDSSWKGKPMLGTPFGFWEASDIRVTHHEGSRYLSLYCPCLAVL